MDDQVQGKKEKKSHVWEVDGLNWYVEPRVATESLLKVERFVGAIHDPSCGQGNIVRELLVAGYQATGTDVVRRAEGNDPWFMGTVDFLDCAYHGPPNIVMNPPFFKAKGAEAFIRKALAVATGKVAVFVDIKFLAGSARANGLFREFPPSRVWIITPRVSCPPGEVLVAGGKAEGGTADWCWLVFDKTAPSIGTSIGWLRAEA